VIFVDTSAWFARYPPKDRHHLAAKSFHVQSREKFVTTDYVVDELLTLLKARANVGRATRVGRALFGGKLANIEWVTESDVGNAWTIFETRRDKEWSFTDCVSLVVMQRLAIRTAFAFDEHFRQFGAVVVAP
jgi:uncharacterized protein